MKLSTLFQAALGTYAFLVAESEASSAHHRLHQVHKRSSRAHGHGHSQVESRALVKRGACAFPTDDPNLVAVTPDQKNAGWAMSPDQECKPGNYCPIACKSGMVMAQWDPNSKYTYPASMNGGLYCDQDGTVKKPFPDKPNCVQGTGAVKAVNQCKSKMSWCQTVLPGNEAMLIPTLVSSEATIAVPDTSYWEKTAAHFYINPPGTGTEGCVWGSESKAVGNWSPYVAGANTDGNGQTFVKIGWNPIWQGSGLAGSQPGFGVKIECPGGGCVGLPCQIDASASASGAVGSKLAAVGAGNAGFCVVTVAKGSTAHIIAFDGSGGNSQPEPPKQSTPASKPPPPPATTSSTPPPPPPPPPPPTSTPTPTPTPPSPSTTISKSSSTSQAPVVSSASPSSTTSTAPPTTSAAPSSSSTILSTSSSSAPPIVQMPGIFHENGTSYSNTSSTAAPSTSFTSTTQSLTPVAPKTTASKGEAGRQQSGAVAGLLVAFIAAAYLF